MEKMRISSSAYKEVVRYPIVSYREGYEGDESKKKNRKKEK